MVKAALAVHEFFQKTSRGFYASAEIKATSSPAPRQHSAVPGPDNAGCNALCRSSPSTASPREHGVGYRVIEEPAQDFPGFRQVLAAIGEPTPPDAMRAFRLNEDAITCQASGLVLDAIDSQSSPTDQFAGLRGSQ